MRHLSIVLCAAILAACTEDPAATEDDGAMGDGGHADVGADARRPDLSPIEEGVTAMPDRGNDAAPPDAIPPDATPPDAMPDAAPPDAAPDPPCAVAVCEGIGIEIGGECTPMFAPTCDHRCVPSECGADGCMPTADALPCDDPLMWMLDVLRFGGRYTTGIATAFRTAHEAGVPLVCEAESRGVCDDMQCNAAAAMWSVSNCEGAVTHHFEFEDFDANGLGVDGEGYFYWNGDSIENNGDLRWTGPLTAHSPRWARAGTSSISVYRRGHFNEPGFGRVVLRISASVGRADGSSWSLSGQLGWGRDVCVREPDMGMVEMIVTAPDGAQTTYEMVADGAMACDGLTPVSRDGMPLAPVDDLRPNPDAR